jgi:hypothetical protein
VKHAAHHAKLIENREAEMIKTLEDLSAQKAALLLAVLAVGSALLSNYFPFFPNSNDAPALGGAPLLPGIYFGVVLCVGVYLWEKKSIAAFAIVLVGAVIAWILAWRTAIAVHDFLNGFRLGDPAAGNLRPLPYMFAIAGFVAGLVGAFGTVIVISIACTDFREPNDWLRTIAAGGVAGVFLHFGDAPSGTVLPLFIVWQAAVAASVAYGLVIPPPKRSKR